jgi:hypothetical protein
MVRLTFASSILITLGASSAQAAFVTHAGSNDPVSEGFAALVSTGTAGSVSDGGVPAWMIQTNIPAATFFYYSPVFTASQRGDLAQGFELTLTARAIPGSASSGSAVGGVFIDIGDRRFDVYLIRNFGLTVTLADSVFLGPDSSLRANGSWVDLDLSASNFYHTYTLAYDGTTQSASLLIDGNLALSGYKGRADSNVDGQFAFGAASGGGLNVNSVQLRAGPITSAVPAPPSAGLLAIGAFGLFGRAGLKRARRHATSAG